MPVKKPANHLKGARLLTEKQVKEIRSDYEKGKRSALELSTKYDVTTGNIYLIVNRRTWKHI